MSGIIAGILLLLNPVTALILFPWMLFLCLANAEPKSRPALSYCLVVVLAFSLLPLAWATRNHYQLGAFVIRTNLGMTLNSSNMDCADSTMVKNELNNCYQAHHPNVSIAEAQLLRDLGEVQYDRKRVADSIAWISSHPQRFRQLTMARFEEFWFPPNEANSLYHAYFFSIATLLSIPGLYLMFQRREPVTPFVAAVILLYPLIYYVVVTDIRYRYPILWLSLLPAGYFISQLLAGYCGESRKLHPTPSELHRT